MKQFAVAWNSILQAHKYSSIRRMSFKLKAS